MGKLHFTHCPNPECSYHAAAPEGTWYGLRGWYRTKWNGQPVRRFQCSKCQTTFSSHTFRATKGLHKPYINREVASLKLMAVSISDIARKVGVTKNTILSRYRLIKNVVEPIHEKRLAEGEFLGNRVQIDELETSELTRLKPVSVALAVSEDRANPERSGKIVSFSVARMGYVRKTGKVAREIYGPRTDERETSRKHILGDIKKCILDQNNFTVATDLTSDYNNLIRDELGKSVTHRHYNGKVKTRTMNTVDDAVEEDSGIKIENYVRTRIDVIAPYGYWMTKKGKHTSLRPRDPLFYMNQKCAKMRATVARLRRRFWGLTRKLENLEAHLWLFLAHNNGYVIDWQTV